MRTIDDLQRLAAFLHREAEEQSPIVGHAERKEWMARHIENEIADADKTLQDLLDCDTDEQVIDLLEERYLNITEPADEDVYDYPEDAYQ